MIYQWKSSVEGLKGYVKIQVLKYAERIALLKELNIANQGKEIVFSNDQIDNLIKIKDIVIKRVNEVSLELPDGTAIQSLDELEYYESYQQVITELSALLFNGVKLGNLKGRP